MSIVLKWFKVNSLKDNPGKFQFMILGNYQQNPATLPINFTKMKETNKLLLLGITLDNK